MRSVWLSGALCLFAVSSAAQEIGKVKYLAGAVTISRAGATQNAAPGDSLQVNDIVRTPSAAGTGVRIVLLDASELTLGSGTELRVVIHNPLTQQTTIEMLHGHLRAKVTPVVKQGGIFQVRTPTAIAVALGTVMQVDTVSDVPIATTAVTADQLPSVPGAGTGVSELMSLTPGMPSTEATDRITQSANRFILDGRRDPARATSYSSMDGDSISSFSLTNSLSGAVTDGIPSSPGAFDTTDLTPGPYNIRISMKSGSNSFHGHEFELYSGTHLNFFSTSYRAQPGGASQPGWDYSIAPNYDANFSTRTSVLQQRFPSLQPFYVNSPSASVTTPSGGEALPNSSLYTSFFFNSRTQNYNALTPFLTSNPYLSTGNRGLDLNVSARAGNTSTNYSRALGLSVGGPLALPRFGEGSSFSGRASRNNYFFFYPSAGTPRIQRETMGFDRSLPDWQINRELKVGANFTYDYNDATASQLSLSPSVQVTQTQNYIAGFGGQNFATDYSASRGTRIVPRRETELLLALGARPPTITDPRVARYELVLGIFGYVWAPYGYDGQVIPSLNAAPSETIRTPAPSNFPWGVYAPPGLGSSLRTPIVTFTPGQIFNPVGGANYPTSSGDEEWTRSIPARLGLPLQTSYTTETSGDEIAARLSIPALTPRAQREFATELPELSANYRIQAGYRFTDDYRTNTARSSYGEFQLDDIPYRSLSRSSRRLAESPYNFLRSEYARRNEIPYSSFSKSSDQLKYNFNRFRIQSVPNTRKYSEYAFSDFIAMQQSSFGRSSYKSHSSWCYHDRLEYRNKWPQMDYQVARQYFGVFYGYKTPVAVVVTVVRSLDDIQPGLLQPASGKHGMWDYPGVKKTIISCFHHYIAVAGYVPGTRTQFGQTAQMIIVSKGEGAQPPRPIFNSEGTSATLQQASFKDVPAAETLVRGVPEFNATGTCTATWVINGVAMFGASNTAFSYKLLGLGRSTGDAIRVLVTNNTNCAVYFIVTFGTILQPHSLEHQIGAAVGILLGGSTNFNNIKSYQIMINFGGGTFVVIVVEPGPAPQHPPELGGPSAEDEPDIGAEQLPPNVAEGVLRSYCLELHKLAPHPETRYDFADAKLQEELGPNAAFLQHIFELVQSGALKIPQGHTLDTLIQWTLWASREGMDEGKFKDAYRTLVHHNYDAQKKKWDKDAEKFVDDSEKTLWPAVAVALAAK